MHSARSVIQDHSDHGETKELANLLRTRMQRLLNLIHLEPSDLGSLIQIQIQALQLRNSIDHIAKQATLVGQEGKGQGEMLY